MDRRLPPWHVTVVGVGDCRSSRVALTRGKDNYGGGVIHPWIFLSDAWLMKHGEGALVALAAKVFVEDLSVDIVGRSLVEESHRRAEFQGVDSAEDGYGIVCWQLKDSRSYFSQPIVKSLTLQVGLGLPESGNAIVICVVGISETLDLREYIPYPMTFLASGLHLAQRFGVSVSLSIQESLKFESIAIVFHVYIYFNNKTLNNNKRLKIAIAAPHHQHK